MSKKDDREAHASSEPREPRFGGRLATRLRQRSDSEHEQAIIRVAIGVFAAVYLVVAVLRGTTIGPGQVATLWICALFPILSAALFLTIVLFPDPSPARRVAGIVLDNGATTLVLLLNQQIAAPLFVVYLWVSFGNGFRYGVAYLAFSAALSVLGFSAAALLHDFWRTSPYVSSGILIGLVVLPAYVAALLRRLRSALVQAEAANVAKTQFLANMSHEIRTPLHGILGLGELLIGSPLDDGQRRLADLSYRSASRLLEIVNEVLDFSKVEAEGVALCEAPFDLRKAVEDVVNLHGETGRGKGLEVRYEIDPALPRLVLGDSLRLGQVLNNLVGNAVKFTPEGRVSVKLMLRRRTSSEAVVDFEVEDTGIGIDPGATRRIFIPFSQADGSMTRRFGGTGLGLPLASRLVEKMGGKVECESSVGVGTIFRFTLRLGLETEGPESASMESPQTAEREVVGAPRWLVPPRVLAAEDNPVNRELLAQFLGSFGCVAEVVENGKEAVEAYRKGEFDVVMMDCQMPEMDGYQAAAAIREVEREPGGRGRRTAIVALTAHAGVGDRERCLAADMDDYLSKPFQAGELLAAVARWMPQGGMPLENRPRAAAAPVAPPPGEPAASTGASRRFVHDLRNVLFSVVGHAELGENAFPEGSPERRRFQKVREAGERAVELLNKEFPGGRASNSEKG